MTVAFYDQSGVSPPIFSKAIPAEQTRRSDMAPSSKTRAKGNQPIPKSPLLVNNSGVGKRLLNVGEAAQYLGLQVETVYKKARLRELPFVKVGRALRFDIEALGRFIEEHTIETID